MYDEGVTWYMRRVHQEGVTYATNALIHDNHDKLGLGLGVGLGLGLGLGLGKQIIRISLRCVYDKPSDYG